MFKKSLIAALTIFTFNAHAVPNKLDTSPKFERAFVSLTPEAHVACYEIAPELNGMSVMFISRDASHNSKFVAYSALEFFCPFLLTYDVRERATDQEHSEYVLKSTRAELSKYPLRFKMKIIPAGAALVMEEYNNDLAIFNNEEHTMKAQTFIAQLRNLMAERVNEAMEKMK